VQIGDSQDPHTIILPYASLWRLPIVTAGIVDPGPRCGRAHSCLARCFKIANDVTSFSGHGMGSYSFFNQGLDIFATRAFEVPDTLPASSLNDLLTIFLDASVGRGGILNLVNDTGGPSTIANPDVPVTVVSYP
jgi:hypothetical protein